MTRSLSRQRHVVAVLASLLTASGALAQAVPDTAAIRELMDAAHVPGLAIATVEGGAVAWTGSFGRADGDAAVDAQTVFEAASLSKPVFATVVLRLAERGEFDLDVPLWGLLPYERLAHDERARQITPRLVLAHRSGLPNWGGTPLELMATPDSVWNYSGEGFVYLQRAVESATGLSLDALARREVFEPFGMTQSGYVWRDGWAPATGHDMIGEPRPLRRAEDGNAASSLVTTAADYARFLAAVLRGEGLATETLDEALRRHTDVPAAAYGDEGDPAVAAHLGWGLGWGVQDDDGRRQIWHWGDNGAFRAFVLGDLDRGDGVVYLTNSENGLALAEDLLALVSDGTPWAARWLGYQRHDAPIRAARIRLRRAFLDEGVDAGLRLYEALDADPALDLDGELAAAARLLASHDRTDDALTVADWSVESAPESAEAWATAGEIQTEAGAHGAAIASLERALALDPQRTDALADRIAWLREGLAAPVEMDEVTLRSFAGTYGPRRVGYREGALYYSREGSTSEARLVPLGGALFRVSSSSTFRIRFIEDEAGVPVAIEGRYASGHRDTSERTE